MKKSRLAYRVSLNDMECICFSPSAAAAKIIAVSGAREAGIIGKREWPQQLQAKRVKKYDYSLAKCHGNGPWKEEYVHRHS